MSLFLDRMGINWLGGEGGEGGGGGGEGEKETFLINRIVSSIRNSLENLLIILIFEI